MPKAHLKPTHGATRSSIGIPPADRKRLETIARAYAAGTHVTPSLGLIYSIALDALATEVRRGYLRPHPDLYSTAPNRR